MDPIFIAIGVVAFVGWMVGWVSAWMAGAFREVCHGSKASQE
jgi:hypothetical protein